MDPLSTFLQQNLLVLLNYYDNQAKTIRAAVSLDLFEHDYRSIASAIYDYLDRYKTPPKDHLIDLFEDVLNDEKDAKAKRKAQHLSTILHEIHSNQNKVNSKYVMDSLGKWIRHQELMRATLQVAEVIEDRKITDEKIYQVEQIFSTALKKKIELFDPGTFLGGLKGLDFLQEEERDTFRTGIDVLDHENVCPQRQNLLLFVGLPKMGKTWFLVNIGKQAVKDGHKVLHISLEMSERQISKRYHQAIFAIAQHRKENSTKTKFRIAEVDDDNRGIKKGDIRSIRLSPYDPKHSLDDSDISKYLTSRRRRLERRLNRIEIKSFPTGQMTLPMLESHLDNLESQYHFVPDLLLIDYPQLMKIDVRNHRLELGKIVQNLRGIGVERNMAVVAVSQSNRGGMGTLRSGKAVITLDQIAEDFSQSQTADIILSYNRTPEEKAFGLARIYVAAAREEEGEFTVLIAQHYESGQFCTRAHRMNKRTQKFLLDRLYVESEED